MGLSLAHKRFLDTAVGMPLLIFLNGLARILGWLLKRPHDCLPVKRVLILKFQGIGSLVIARPAIQKVKLLYPEAELILWGTPSIIGLARLIPEIDRFMTLEDSSMFSLLTSLVRALFNFWKKPIDWAIDFEVYSKMSSVLMTLTCARNRAGFAIESVKYRQNIHTHLLFFNRYRYLGDAYLRLVLLLNPSLNLQDQGEFDCEKLKLDWKVQTKPPAILTQLPESFIVIHSHCGPLAPEKRWPLANFKQFIRLLHEVIPNFEVVLIGHGEDEVLGSQELENLPNVRNLTGKLNLQELIQVLSSCKLFVSGDSGPLHIALTLRRPVLALFGPTQPDTYFPKRPNATALYSQKYCSPCVHHWSPPPCAGDNRCMKEITVEAAIQAALSLLGLPVPSALSRSKNPSDLEASEFFPGLVYRRSH